MYWYSKHYFEADIFTLNNEPKTFKLTSSSKYKDNSKLKLQKKPTFSMHEYQLPGPLYQPVLLLVLTFSFQNCSSVVAESINHSQQCNYQATGSMFPIPTCFFYTDTYRKK